MKSLAVATLAAGTFALAFLDGDLDPERFAHFSASSAFAIGLFASTTGALVGWAARPEVQSRIALALRGARPALVVDPARGAVRELPGVVQRALFVGVFACIALATFTNEATARIGAVPEDLSKKSRAEYCFKEEAKPAEPEPEPVVEQPVDQAGCALVKRAYDLGYRKTLGDCGPKAIVRPKAPVAKKVEEVCTRRQLDEPFVHYAWRRVVEMASGTSPIDATDKMVDELQIRSGYARDLLADIKHSITGTPHASHHLWVNLPDPRPRSWLAHLLGEEQCTMRFEDLRLWPELAKETASTLFEHVLGQLLFATRFGTPASCSDYQIHWGAPTDACSRLAADPVAFLDEWDALGPVRAVLDRRKRQIAIRKLVGELGHKQTLPVPPEARAVVSLGCFIVAPAGPGGAPAAPGGAPAGPGGAAGPAGQGAATGRDVTLDGEAIVVRELGAPAVEVTSNGVVDLYVRLGLLLGGTPYTGPVQSGADRAAAEPPGALDDPAHLLLRLEPLVDADPFVDRTVARAPLARSDVAAVYPYERHLFGFVDAFRRVYVPQRGRL